jgi:hypothetical protein
MSEPPRDYFTLGRNSSQIIRDGSFATRKEHLENSLFNHHIAEYLHSHPETISASRGFYENCTQPTSIKKFQTSTGTSSWVKSQTLQNNAWLTALIAKCNC